MAAGDLFRVIEWVREHGEPRAVDRLRLRVLPMTVRERLSWDAITLATACSDAYLEAVTTAAVDLVGKPYPHSLRPRA